MDLDPMAAKTQPLDQIHHFRIAQVWQVLLEVQAQHQRAPRAVERIAWLVTVHDPFSDMVAHSIIDTPPGENDLGMMAQRLGTMGQIEGIDTDAMTADEAWAEIEKVPFGARGF